MLSRRSPNTPSSFPSAKSNAIAFAYALSGPDTSLPRRLSLGRRRKQNFDLARCSGTARSSRPRMRARITRVSLRTRTSDGLRNSGNWRKRGIDPLAGVAIQHHHARGIAAGRLAGNQLRRKFVIKSEVACRSKSWKMCSLFANAASDRIRRGHLWVYRSDILNKEDATPGSIVLGPR